jgi:predicted DNA-binding protein YlxM (UPF0122 family)
MHKLSPAEKYSVKEIAEALKLSTILANGIRIYFGDPISINELKQISRGKFLSCKNFGSKRLREFQNALSIFSTNNERAVIFRLLLLKLTYRNHLEMLLRICMK